jgi:hypothetical protein
MASIVAGDCAASTGAMNPKFPETAISVVPMNATTNPTNPSRPILTDSASLSVLSGVSWSRISTVTNAGPVTRLHYFA